MLRVNRNGRNKYRPVQDAKCWALAAGSRCDVLGAGCTPALHFQHNPLVVFVWQSSDGNHLNSADFPEVPGGGLVPDAEFRKSSGIREGSIR
jgi:hypothetical protein